MDTDDEPGGLSAAAIARLAGVSRAAVTGWRARYPDFPQPTSGTEARPIFDRTAVAQWLASTGKASQLAAAGETDTGTHLTDIAEQMRQLREQAAERSVADLTSPQVLAGVMAALLPRATAVAAADRDDDAELPAVLDPACGDATLLAAVANRFGGGIKVVGQDLLDTAAARTAVALRETAEAVPYEVHIGDSLVNDRLAEYLGRAAAVVCDPPFNQTQWPWAELATDPRWMFGTPGPRDSDLAWVQHCYAHLRPRGVAVVAVSPRTCVQASGQHIRAALVRTGALRDVIALPKGLGSAAESDVFLLVLQRPHGTSGHEPVRMIDLSRLADLADVPREHTAWQRLFDDSDPTVSRNVSRLDLLDGDVNLLPSRYVAVQPSASADDLDAVMDRLRALYQSIGDCLPRFTAPSAPPRYSFVSFGELERVGTLSIRSRDTTPREGDVLMRVLGHPPIVATGTPQDDTGIAHVVEIDASRLDAHFVAAFLRAETNALPVTNTLGMLSRDDLRRCRIPRLPLVEQRRYGDAFRRLHQLDDVVAALARTSGHVIDETFHALTTGALDPDLRPARQAPDDETRKP